MMENDCARTDFQSNIYILPFLIRSNRRLYSKSLQSATLDWDPIESKRADVGERFLFQNDRSKKEILDRELIDLKYLWQYMYTYIYRLNPKAR